MAHTAYIGLGANLGDARAVVLAAMERLRGLGTLTASSLYRSAPVDAGGPDFINAAALLHTAMDAPSLLAAMQAIEHDFGRLRPYRNAPRSLDLDLLLFDDLTLTDPALTLPHPRLHQRAFVLQPLLELDPDLHAPGLGALASHVASTADQAISRLPPTIPN